MKLNGATIPDAIVQRVIQRCGMEHSFADFVPARTALLVIDLQHAFMNDAIGFAAVKVAGVGLALPLNHAAFPATRDQAAEQRRLLG
jgi:hypothetical protein